MWFLIIFCVIFLTVPNFSFDNYCNVTCLDSNKINHTVCLRPNCSIGKKCGNNVKLDDLEPGDEKHLLKLHNDLRAQIATGNISNQPAAEHLPALEWDTELAFVANCWAKSCEYKHDIGCRDVRGQSVGQNLGKVNMYKGWQSLENIVNKWFSEHRAYLYPRVHPISWRTPQPGTEHYTQLVWANTTHLGCSKIVFKSRVHLVCNYAPAGNILNQLPYKSKIDLEPSNQSEIEAKDLVCSSVSNSCFFVVLFITYLTLCIL